MAFKIYNRRVSSCRFERVLVWVLASNDKVSKVQPVERTKQAFRNSGPAIIVSNKRLEEEQKLIVSEVD